MTDHQYVAASWIALAIAAALCALLPSRAHALAACPTPTPAAGSLSDTTTQVSALRQDSAQTCRAITERIDSLDAHVVTVADRVQTANDRLLAIKTAVEGTVQVHADRGTSAAPMYVSGPAGAQALPGPTGSAGDPQWMRLADPDGEQLYDVRFWIAFVAGLIVATGVVSGIRRAWAL